jgi:hypothetical protein
MATTRHPVTGEELNDITVLRTGRVSAAERDTAQLLYDQGHARWLVGAMLGRCPLGYARSGAPPERRKRAPNGASLSRAAARSDPRQLGLLDAEGEDHAPASGTAPS